MILDARGKPLSSIYKAESHSRTKVPKREVGQPHIVSSSQYIQELAHTELQMPRRLQTYENMFLDDCVYQSVDLTNAIVSIAMSGGEVIAGPSGSSKSQTAADFANYCIRNMNYGTWLNAVDDMNTDIVYGWSTLNIVVEKRNYGPYKGSWVLKKLSPRHQKKVYGWLFDKNQRDFLGLVQQPMVKSKGYKNGSFAGNITEYVSGRYYDSVYPVLKREQILHSTYNGTCNNPQGDSPFAHCFTAWKEKELVNKYELIGVSKDLAGLIILRVPSDLIDKASEPDIYPMEAEEYRSLQQDAGDLHSAKNTFMVLTSDADEITKKHIYDIEVKGIDGQGRQFKTVEILDQKRKAIYNVFGTSHLLLGQGDSGSYALSTTLQGTHGLIVQKNINQKVDVINHQLLPRLFAANGVYLDYKDMPVFKPADPDKLDFDTASKFIQRVASVEKMTPAMLEHICKQIGVPIDGVEDIDFTSKGGSRAADGLSTAGEGTSTSRIGQGDAATSNNEAGGVEKGIESGRERYLTQDGKYIIDMATGEPI